MKPVLFLDIDGVLNSNAFNAGRLIVEGHNLDPRCIKRLAVIIEATDCNVVLSSTWRIHYPLVEVQRMLERCGLPRQHRHRFIGVTPHDFSVDHRRGQEIASWLARCPVDRFCILDDDDQTEPYKHKQVKTDAATGLLDAHVERVIAILAK